MINELFNCQPKVHDMTRSVGRPPLGPLAFRDVASMMQLAHIQIMSGRSMFIRFDAESEKYAIRTIHRMNRWRQMTRSTSDDGSSRYDAYTIRRDGKWIVMERRPDRACIAIEDEHGSIPLDALEDKSIPIEQMLDAHGNIRADLLKPEIKLDDLEIADE